MLFEIVSEVVRLSVTSYLTEKENGGKNKREKIHSMGCSSSRQQHEGRGRKEEASAVVGTAVIGEIQAGNDAISMLFAKMYR